MRDKQKQESGAEMAHPSRLPGNKAMAWIMTEGLVHTAVEDVTLQQQSPSDRLQ